MTEKEAPSRKAFVLPSRTLQLLGGVLVEHQLPSRKVAMVEEGAYLWGVPHLEAERIRAVFNHSCLVGRGAWYMAQELKERSEALGDGQYTGGKLDEGLAAEAGMIHDAVKMHSGKAFLPEGDEFWIPGIENLTPQEKESLGYPPDYKEISSQADEILVSWLKKHQFPQEIVTTVVGHDFPQDEKAVATIYQKIIIWVDSSCGQEFTSVESRLDEIFQRWVINYVINQEAFPKKSPAGLVKDHWSELKFDSQKPPRISPERGAQAIRVIEKAKDELFGYLGMSEEEFIAKYQLNEDASMPPWEKVLRKSWQRDYKHQRKGGEGAPRAGRIKEVLKKKGI